MDKYYVRHQRPKNPEMGTKNIRKTFKDCIKASLLLIRSLLGRAQLKW